MADLRPDTQFEIVMRIVINLAAAGLFVGLIALVVATIVHEAG